MIDAARRAASIRERISPNKVISKKLWVEIVGVYFGPTKIKNFESNIPKAFYMSSAGRPYKESEGFQKWSEKKCTNEKTTRTFPCSINGHFHNLDWWATFHWQPVLATAFRNNRFGGPCLHWPGRIFLVCASSVIATKTSFSRQRCHALRRCKNLVPFFCTNAGAGCLELDLGARVKMVGVPVTKEEGRGAAQARYKKTNPKKCTSPMTAASRWLCTSCSKEHKIESEKRHTEPLR